MLKPENISHIHEPEYSQPICTTVQIALIELLRSWGIHPAVVIGHSSGEIAAAFCVGALSRNSAWKVAYYRGVVAALQSNSQKTPQTMMAVALSEEEIKPYLESIQSEPGSITVACINSPRNVTVSGDENKIDALKSRLEADEVFARKLRVNVAYHSPHMVSVASAYLGYIQDIEMGPALPQLPTMFSTVTGTRAFLRDVASPDYWVKNLTGPVRFLDAVAKIHSQPAKKLGNRNPAQASVVSVDHLLEIGPHATLQSAIKEILGLNAKTKVFYTSVLFRGKSAIETALEAAGSLHCTGFAVNLLKVGTDEPKSNVMNTLVDLPAYPFNHDKRYWVEGRLSKGFRFRKHPPHELLGSQVQDWNEFETRWQNMISTKESPWLKDHKVCYCSVTFRRFSEIDTILLGKRRIRLSRRWNRCHGYRSGSSSRRYHQEDCWLQTTRCCLPENASRPGG